MDNLFENPSTLVGQMSTVISRSVTRPGVLNQSTNNRSMIGGSTKRSAQNNSNDLHKCFTCNTSILKHEEFKMVEINDFKFHDDCCQCNSCMKTLENEMYCENNCAFCTECYTELFSFDCQVCETPIISGIKMSYLGNYYHHDCFACVSCRKSLVNEPAKAVFQGKLYCLSCERNAINNSSKYICDICHLIVNTQPLRYIDQFGKILRIHPHHLRCRLCESKLDSFGQVDGQLALCSNCSQDDRSKPCYFCGKTPSHRLIKFLGKVYHIDCFTCCKCGTKLSNDPKSFQGEPYCSSCYHLHAKQRCSGCTMGDCQSTQYKVLGKRWGIDHMFCYRCNTTIPYSSNRGFHTIDVNIYCSRCFRKSKPAHHYYDSTNLTKMTRYMTIREKK